ncbi:hypothetical protein GOBAR_DD16557 [Gossypium barbadense]|nr:hypothetical protein GOBAR_DD16557 [Gossypium barbadense]
MAYDDFLVWGAEPSGEFFVHSGYRLFVSSGYTMIPDYYRLFYTTLSKLQLPGKWLPGRLIDTEQWQPPDPPFIKVLSLEIIQVWCRVLNQYPLRMYVHLSMSRHWLVIMQSVWL